MSETPITDDDDWDDERDPDLDGCDHENAEVDILTGRAICSCGHVWWMSSAEFQREIEFQAEYMEGQIREAEPDER